MSPVSLQRAVCDGHQDGNPHLPQERGSIWIKSKIGQAAILQPKNLIPREDLFQKMIDQDYQAPLLEEVKLQAVTKER